MIWTFIVPSRSSNKVLNFGQLLIKKLSFSNLVESKNFIDNNIFRVKINKLINILEQKEIVSELDDSLRVSMILDKPNKQTIVNVYEGGKENNVFMGLDTI